MGAREVETTTRNPELVGAVLAEPVSFGKYRLVRRLGTGGTATVFLAATNDANGQTRFVVIKRLHEHLNEEPASRKAFLDEARLMESFRHPGIVRILESGDADGRAYFAMEYLEGRDLSKMSSRLAANDESFPGPIAARIVADALDALHYAHELTGERGERWNVVHRDVSPQNLFVTHDGHVLLLDFGIAKATARTTHTATGIVKGKFAYIPPEQARGLAVDRRADLWSMGVVLWELLAGERLFAATSEFATLSGATTGQVPRLRDVLMNVDEELDTIANRALQRDVEARYATAAEMRRELTAYLETHPATPEDIAAFFARIFGEDVHEDRKRFEEFMTPTVATPTPTGRRVRAAGATPGRTPGSTQAAVGVVALLVVGGIVGTALMQDGDDPASTSTSLEAPGASSSMGSPAIRSPGSALANAPGDTSPSPIVERAPPTPSIAPAPTRAPRPTIGSETPRNPPPTGETVSGESTPPPAPVAETTPETATTRPPGTLFLVSVPWANATLDGHDVGTTPILGASLAEGEHTVVLDNPELGAHRVVQVTVTSGQATRLRVRLEP